MLEELLRSDCDIISLCEVDHYDDWIRPLMSRVGYRGQWLLYLTCYDSQRSTARILITMYTLACNSCQLTFMATVCAIQ
jgi:mRNA deadenylase 3'-5' endonuclease subunit Ccr4